MATIHILDNSTIIAKGRLSTSGKIAKFKKQSSYNGKFKFWIDDKLDKTINVDLSGAKSKSTEVQHEYGVKPTPVDKSFYSFSYALFTGEGRKEKQAGDKHNFQIWPHEGSLVVKNIENDSKINDFKFLLNQPSFESNKEKNIEIEGGGENGKYAFNLHPGAEYKIIARSPWTIEKWVEGKQNVGAQREIKVKKHFVAEFIKPLGKNDNGKFLEIYDENAQKKAAKKNPILKQYVNLPTANKGWDAKGPLVTIEVGVKGDKDKKSNERLGGSGKFVHFKLKFSGEGGDKSKRSYPKTEPKTGSCLSSGNLKVVDDGVDYSGKVELSSNEKTGLFQVELGYAGGDTCEIKIGGTPECVDATLNFVNWRKLEYELLYPNTMTNLSEVDGKKDIPDALKQKVKERLEVAYVEYELSKSLEFTKAKIKNAAHKYCFTNSQAMGEAGDAKDRFYMDIFMYRNLLAANAITGVAFSNPFPKTRLKIILAHESFAAGSVKKVSFKRVLTNTETTSIGFFPPKNPLNGSSPTLDVSQGSGYYWQFCYKDGMGKWSIVKFATNDSATLEFNEVNGDMGDDADKKIFEVKHVGSGDFYNIWFEKSGVGFVEEVTALDKSDLKDWVRDDFNSVLDKNIFRSADKKLKLQITGNTSDNARLAAVKTAVQEAFDAKFKICDKVGRDWNGNCIGGELDPAWFNTDNWRKLKITLPEVSDDDPGKLIGPSQAIYVEFAFDEAFGINGCAGGGKQILKIPHEANDNIPDALAGARSSTICHELGHSMGMTITPKSSQAPTGMPLAKHVDNGGTYYSNYDDVGKGLRAVHQGSHCAHGIADASTAGKIKQGNGSCIMYGAGGLDDSRTAFCDACQTYIKSRKLTDITINWKAQDRNNS